VKCDQPQQVGTIARIRCGPYYDMPKNLGYFSQKLTCQSTGTWDKVAIRCTPRCGRVTQAATAYVINGKKAKNVAEVPWVAAVYKRDYVICSGTILSEKLIVTAAHCFFREQSGLAESVALESLSLFKIAVGKYYRDPQAQEMFNPQFFNISEVIYDPGYDGFNGFFSADFIVLVLDGYIIFRPHVVPICIDLETDSDEYYTVESGLTGTVAGENKIIFC
jgi:Trypsin